MKKTYKITNGEGYDWSLPLSNYVGNHVSETDKLIFVDVRDDKSGKPVEEFPVRKEGYAFRRNSLIWTQDLKEPFTHV